MKREKKQKANARLHLAKADLPNQDAPSTVAIQLPPPNWTRWRTKKGARMWEVACLLSEVEPDAVDWRELVEASSPLKGKMEEIYRWYGTMYEGSCSGLLPLKQERPNDHVIRHIATFEDVVKWAAHRNRLGIDRLPLSIPDGFPGQERHSPAEAEPDPRLRGSYLKVIATLLGHTRSLMHPSENTATKLHRMLREEGFAMSENTVRTIVKEALATVPDRPQ